ncbi:AmmeMemoRadiSam system protein B [Plasmodium fragile]|uniref:AmmeMemoRadiSam system protein B n=1 Tax=Plasmodium fragile TaxID=5857 RepID=A0A0D9QPW4_PLAFR|nr:AmmeMemoRadiSam system protein B [Plasmodium fragile]KJP89084.1 AmmeMemoRadiSam system protein B [Plasmodium fragile]
MANYRKAYHAGSWYSSSGSALKNSIDALFESINCEKQSVKAAICPHAGYDYALKTNSHVYACISVENVKNIFILGPNHHIYNKGCLFPQVEKYETPLGFLQINKEVISDIMQNDVDHLFDFIGDEDDEEEHSIEMQLPLIKYIIKEKDIKIIPIYVGCIGNDIQKINCFCNPIKKYFQDEGNLFLFSSDFCHYGRRFSFTNILQKYNDTHIFKQVENMDKDAANIISRHNLVEFIEYLNKTHNTICGSNPIKMMLQLLQGFSGNVSTKLMHYSQSNQARSTNDSSVSYAGMVSFIN